MTTVSTSRSHSRWKAKQAVLHTLLRSSCHLLCSAAGICCQVWLWVAAAASRAQCSTLCHGNAPSSPDSQPPSFLRSDQRFPPSAQKTQHWISPIVQKFAAVVAIKVISKYYQLSGQMLALKWPNYQNDQKSPSKWQRGPRRHTWSNIAIENRFPGWQTNPSVPHTSPTPANHHRTQKKAEIK